MKWWATENPHNTSSNKHAFHSLYIGIRVYNEYSITVFSMNKHTFYVGDAGSWLKLGSRSSLSWSLCLSFHFWKRVTWSSLSNLTVWEWVLCWDNLIKLHIIKLCLLSLWFMFCTCLICIVSLLILQYFSLLHFFSVSIKPLESTLDKCYIELIFI